MDRPCRTFPFIEVRTTISEEKVNVSLAEKKLSEDDHHHYHGSVRAGNYSCTAGLDDFGIEFDSNIVEIIPKIRPTADGDSLGMSSGLKIGNESLLMMMNKRTMNN